MKLDVVIVAYQSEAVIEQCLSSVLAIPERGSVVVVDHGDGEAARLAGTLGARTVHDPTNPGFGAGQNRGVSGTTAPLVLLCNPDAEVLPEAVLEGARFLAAHPGVAAVQGVILNTRTDQPERSAGVEVGPLHLVGRALGARRLLCTRWGARLAGRARTLRDHAERVPDGPTVVESLAATALLVRRSAFEAVGGFDESFFLYGEDLDFCRRLRHAGWTLVAQPEVWATHASGGSAESGWSREANWWRGTLQFGAERWGRRAWATAVAAAVLRWSRLAVLHPRHARDAFAAMIAEPLRFRARRRPTTVATREQVVRFDGPTVEHP